MHWDFSMKKFTRTKENFTCVHCGAEVFGNGYTNHCPKCLWSKHVDNNPGDRQSNCGGMMEPIYITTKGRDYIITHKCQKCGKIINQKSSANDDISAIIAISSSASFIYGR